MRCGTTAGTVLALALVAAPVAPAATDYGVGRPLAVVAHAPGDAEVYWRGADGFLWEDAESSGHWTGPIRTPVGSLASAPTAAIGAQGYDDVFWKGTNGQLWEAGDSPHGWVGPTQIGMGPLGSQPTAASIPNASGVAEIDVFWYGTGTRVNLWRARYLTSTGTWSGPSEIGMGPLGSPPTATEQQTSAGPQIQVYWKGANGALWEGDTSGGSTWSGPTSHGMGPLGSAPAVASLGYGNEDVFWGGTFGRLWQASWDSTSWNGVNLNGPTSVGFGPMASAPSVAAASPDEYDVFWVGTDGDLWEARLVGQTWTSEQSLGPMVAPPPPPPAQPPPAQPPPARPTPVTVIPPRGRPGHVRVRIVMSWTFKGIHTRLSMMRFGRLPSRATITVTCRGRGCPRRAMSANRRHLRRLTRSLESRRYRAGQRLIITIRAPGLVSERAQVKIRDGRLPLARLL